MERRYPTRRGVAVSPFELGFSEGYGKRHNNHHGHFTRRAFARTAVTEALRNLERHQYEMDIDEHNRLHRIYAPPQLPTEEQAAKEVIDAYDQGEMFKIRDHGYELKEIPPQFVDSLVAKYSLVRVFDMKPSHASPERLAS